MTLRSIAIYVIAIDAVGIALSALANGLGTAVEAVRSDTIEPVILLVSGLVLVSTGWLVRAHDGS